MKLNCGPTWAERYNARHRKHQEKVHRLSNWHRFFCLLPRRMTDANGYQTRECRWLEYVERKGDLVYSDYTFQNWWTWEYRPIAK